MEKVRCRVYGEIKKSPDSKGWNSGDVHTNVSCAGFACRLCVEHSDYLFENWLALLAFLRPYFFLSFILESLVRNPAALSAGL